ncbi:MAG: NAD(P)/FAD-dependent oxidoreductase, partial [Euryarchaeota archaeon]|nr:NAD(P)/FAD-dependent oxidoreductase [Euryarchaeota archaeon]
MAEVVVVGSGLAGLAAAYEASRHGHNVTILEAGQKVGGRGTSINMCETPYNAGPHLLKWGGPLHILL